MNRRQFDRLAELIDGAAGRTVRGGGTDADECTIEPTVIADPDLDSVVMNEEIFGPVLPVVRVDSLDAAIGFVRRRPKPLAAYLFSSRKSDRRRVVDEISAGGMVVNQAAMQVLVRQLPFGGVGNSGMGTYHGEWGFQTFSHRKSVLKKPARPDLSLIYPPYSPRTEKVLRRLF